MRRLERLRVWLAAAGLAVAGWAGAAPPGGAPIVIGFDSEIGHRDSTSDDAIRLGIEAAIEELNAAGGLLGRRLALEERDNRSLPARGVENMAAFIANPDVVAVFGGKYSPVVLEMMPSARAAGMPVLVPWSAADAITRAPEKPNVAYRVGLTDSMAITALLGAAQRAGLRRVALFAPRNAWGRSCADALQKAIEAEFRDLQVAVRLWHNRGDRDFGEQLREARAAGADFVLGVLNEAEGAGIVKALAQLPPGERLPVLSHWGITGGDFPTMAGPALREVDLRVIQTTIASTSRDPRVLRMLERAATRLSLPSPRHFTSAAAMLHAYDLTHLLARAVRAAGTTRRDAVRRALEGPIAFDGTLKQYRSPFAGARHEALGLADLHVASFDATGILVPASPRR